MLNNDTKNAMDQTILELLGFFGSMKIIPELLLSQRFINGVVRAEAFRSRLLAVVIDEAHVIAFWGPSFRKKYSELGSLRALLPPQTPFVAMSATLSPRVKKEVLSKLQYGKDQYENIDVGNDRPNVTLAVRAMQHPLESYRDLDFIIPAGARRPSDIPKSFIYADNVMKGLDIEDHITDLLAEELKALGLVRTYSAAFTKEYRMEVMRLFKEGIVRILICTDAAGMVSSVNAVTSILTNSEGM
jgi:superfamily II DNA helicase RecQ